MKKKNRKYQELSALKGKMRSEKETVKSMANFLGIAPNTFCLKINGISEFTCSEIHEICKILTIPPEDIVKYFFPSMILSETSVNQKIYLHNISS